MSRDDELGVRMSGRENRLQQMLCQNGMEIAVKFVDEERGGETGQEQQAEEKKQINLRAAKGCA